MGLSCSSVLDSLQTIFIWLPQNSKTIRWYSGLLPDKEGQELN